MNVWWLWWCIRTLKQWLAGVVAREITTLYKAGRDSDSATGTAITVSADAVKGATLAIYESARVAAYIAWFVQVCVMRAQALQHGQRLRYIPSMMGVAPSLIDNVMREELRITSNTIHAPINDVVERVAARVASVVAQTARRTVVATVEDDTHTRDASLVYALEHGAPVARFLHATYEDEDSVMYKTRDSDATVRALIDMTVEEWDTTHRDITNTDYAITDDMIADWRVLKPNMSDDEIDVFGRAWKAAALAEIDMAVDVPERIFPNTWYYEWMPSPSGTTRRDGKRAIEYIVPPNNAVFDWLKMTGELGQHTPLKYMSAEDYRARAIEIVESLPPEWHVEQNLRWARIPTGDYTCAFCLVLASRGAVYKTDVSAQLNGFDHDLCDCLVVPVYDPDDYPFKDVVDAAYKVYSENKDVFQPKYSRNLYETRIARGIHKGKVVKRHKTYINVPRRQLQELTAHMPRVDNSAYKAWEKKQIQRLLEHA